MRLAFMLIALTASLGCPALAQTPATLGDSAKALIGIWEFSNADRDKICSATFKSDPTKFGFKVEFEKKCAELFPVVGDVVAPGASVEFGPAGGRVDADPEEVGGDDSGHDRGEVGERGWASVADADAVFVEVFGERGWGFWRVPGCGRGTANGCRR